MGAVRRGAFLGSGAMEGVLVPGAIALLERG